MPILCRCPPENSWKTLECVCIETAKLEEPCGALLDFVRLDYIVKTHRFRERRSNCHSWIQGCEWVLKDNLNFLRIERSSAS